jgi:hypothetical protein
MASLALTVVGSLVPGVGPILGPILGAMGSYIDNAFLLPALFPPEDTEGPRLNELQLQSAEEGASANYIAGAENRVAGTIIWISDLEETEHHETIGGKGGGGQDHVTYQYFVSLAVAIAPHTINGIERVFAEGNVVYEEVDDPSASSNQLSGTVITAGYSFGSPARIGGVPFYTFQIDSPNGGPDLSAFRSGVDCVISGFSNGANNGTFGVISSSFTASSGASRLRVQNKNCVTESAGATVTITQTVPPFFPDKVKDVRIYNGGHAAVDSIIEAIEDPTSIGGQVPPFNGTAYVVFERLALADFGNRIPQLNFIVRGDAGTVTAPTVIGRWMDRAGRSGKYDTSRASGTMRGVTVVGPVAASKALQPIMMGYDIIEQERGEDVHFFDRELATVIDVSTDHLSARETGTDASEYPIQVEDDNGVEIPAEVNIRYIDYEADYQFGSQRHRVQEFDSDAVLNINLPIVLNQSGAEARAIAKRTAWYARANRQPVKLSLPARYLDSLENDVLRFVALDQLWNVLVRQVDIGANFILRLDTIVESRDIVTQPATAESPTNKNVQIFVPPFVPTYVVDIPPIYPSTTLVPGFIAGTAIPGGASWSGAVLYESLDDSEFTFTTNIVGEAAVGYVTSVLADGVVGSWDRANSVTLELLSGNLESVTEIECLNGMNRLLIGEEIIGFQTATLVGGKTWTVSKLLRGLRNTESKTGSHAADDLAIHLNDHGLTFVEINHSAIGQTRYYKIIPIGGAIADYSSWQVQLSGENIKPFSPADLQYNRESPSTDDVSISWIRRTRQIMRLIGQLDEPPLTDGFEKYEVDILNAAGSTVLRTTTVTDSSSFVYTSAMQTADGLVAGSTAFSAKVYQKGTAGRGRASASLAVLAT